MTLVRLFDILDTTSEVAVVEECSAISDIEYTSFADYYCDPKFVAILDKYQDREVSYIGSKEAGQLLIIVSAEA